MELTRKNSLFFFICGISYTMNLCQIGDMEFLGFIKSNRFKLQEENTDIASGLYPKKKD